MTDFNSQKKYREDVSMNFDSFEIPVLLTFSRIAG